MQRFLLILAFLFVARTAVAQSCNTPGQRPETAFPVCGTSLFRQTEVPVCVNRSLKVPGCDDAGASQGSYADKNPFYYRFTCYETGTLGFLIKPNDQNEDYDWQLYDITNRDPQDIFTDASTVVTGNWAGTYGNTGTSDAGSSSIECASNPADRKNTFAKMPTLQKGHVYLLLVSHYSDSQSGYTLSFGGGTALITDPAIPHLQAVERNCDASQLGIKLSKKIKCSSIAADGTDFTLNASGVTITGASAVICSTNFDADSITLQLSAPLPAGNYIVGVKAGSDENTLLDYCDNWLPQTDTLHLTVVINEPAKMEKLLPLACAPQQVRVFFEKPIQCASIAADGSNFNVAGSYPVAVSAAAGACADGLSKEVIVTLARPLYTTGTFVITLQKDFNGNPIVDACGLEPPIGSRLQFAVKDTVSAAFTPIIKYGCDRDTIAVSHNGAHDVRSWSWLLDDNQKSTAASAQGIYTAFDTKTISLAVSNGFCADTVSQAVVLDNYLAADFTMFADLCPQEPVQFTGTAVGLDVKHHWDFGDGTTASEAAPLHTFTTPTRLRNLMVRYTITDRLGCTVTAAKPATLYTSCFLDVPNAFTPNNDGLNDYLAPLNAVKAENLTFSIYNRWGQLVYTSSDWHNGWDGTFKGQPQPAATYVWMLRYTDRDSGATRQRKGTAVLIR